MTMPRLDFPQPPQINAYEGLRNADIERGKEHVVQLTETYLGFLDQVSQAYSAAILATIEHHNENARVGTLRLASAAVFADTFQPELKRFAREMAHVAQAVCGELGRATQT